MVTAVTDLGVTAPTQPPVTVLARFQVANTEGHGHIDNEMSLEVGLRFAVVADVDVGSIGPDGFAVPFAIAQGTRLGFDLSINGRIINELDVYPSVLLFVATSSAGLKTVSGVSNAMAQKVGFEGRPVVDLRSIDQSLWGGEIDRAISRALLDELRPQAERNVKLSREVYLLRSEHQRIQSVFEGLERFVYSNNLAWRTESGVYPPNPELGSIKLKDGEKLEQRVPVASPGLSDIGLYLRFADDESHGVLTVSLTSIDDDKLRGQWEVSADTSETHPVRLSMPTGMESDEVATVLRVTWEGEGTVELLTSTFHPDPRLSAQVLGRKEDRVLAMKFWRYVPGCEAPVSAGAILPVWPQPADRSARIVGGDLLSRAIDLSPAGQSVEFFPDTNTLQVHALDHGIAAAVLPRIAAPGLRSITARIRSRSESAPRISYAIAVAPKAAQRIGGALPKFDSSLISQWVSAPPLEASQIELLLKKPLEKSCDLYLMTKLTDPKTGNAFAWSTFDTIRMIYA